MTISSHTMETDLDHKPRYMVFGKMEHLIQEMQHTKNGVPVKSQKSFLQTIPSVFTGTDIISWLKRRLNIAEDEEAQHLACLFCQYGYIFPVADRVLVVKDDTSLYRFQVPYYWPSQSLDPDNVAYAIHLTKRTIRNKQKHGLEEYEQVALSKLQKMLCDKKEFIESQAMEQVKLAKERKRTDKIIADSQERAFWRLHRPPPGQMKCIEEGPKRNFQPSQMAIRRTRKDMLSKQVQYLKKTLNMCRAKTSQALETYILWIEQYHINDPMLHQVLPSNPWITEDTTFWQLCEDYADSPTELRVQMWALSFRELLKDPLGRREFEIFLKKEYSQENLRFWHACEEIKSAPLSRVPSKIQTVYREFLTAGSPHEVNIDSRTSEAVQRNMQAEKTSRFTFEAAQEHIFVLMKKDSYPRFLRSEHYKTLLANAVQPEGKKRFFNFGSRKKTLTPSPKPKRRGSASENDMEGSGSTVAHHSYSTGNLRELEDRAVILRRDINSSDSSLTRCDTSPNLSRRQERASSTRGESPRKSRNLQLEVPKHMSLNLTESSRGEPSSCLALTVPSKTNVVAPWEGTE